MIRATIAALLTLFFAPALALAAPDDRDGVLEAEFEGKVAYFGNYTGTSSVLAEQPRGARDVPCPYRDNRCRKATVGGGVKVVLEFHGPRVIGFFYAVDGFRGPEGLKLGSLTGRRVNDGSCELFQADGSRWTGICGANEFTGDITTADGIPNAFNIRFNTVAMHMRDLREIKQKKWEAQRREQRVESLRDRLHGDPREAFFAAAELESYSWTPGGIPGERFPAPEFPRKFKRNKTYDLRSDYPLPSGGNGWVMVRFNGDQFTCVASSRRPNCGPINDPLPIVVADEDDPEGWFTADGRVITDLRAAEPGKQP
ncbi:hypothetical protein [Sphingomonas sp.]|jgi:hypothetical protein|uniref:hypothetical protein n=1 Tax=Sphingomonas sp. TaxID=28214 RepID=UPI002EDBAF72